MTKVRHRIRGWLLVLGVFVLLAGFSMTASAELLKRYQVSLQDKEGHSGVELVCAGSERNAETKALAKWGHEGHQRWVVSVEQVGICD